MPSLDRSGCELLLRYIGCPQCEATCRLAVIMWHRCSGHRIPPQITPEISAITTASSGLWIVSLNSCMLTLTTRTSVAGPGQSGSVQIVSRTETRQATPWPSRDRTSRLIRCLCQRAFAVSIAFGFVKTILSAYRLRRIGPPSFKPFGCAHSIAHPRRPRPRTDQSWVGFGTSP